MQRVLVLNGPNLNLLGTRRPEIYGTTTLAELEERCRTWGAAAGFEVDCFQSNHEGELLDRMHEARGAAAGIVLNAGALTHTSYALHDAIEAVGLPTVEVHISNVKAREDWRRRSVVAPACVASIYGRGVGGYRWALEHLAARLAAPPRDVAYGPDPDQQGALRVPDGPGPHPVAVLFHGGFWRDPWQRDLMDPLAAALTARGHATWNVEYRRVGTGGGWPATLVDAATAVDHVTRLADAHPLDAARTVLVGHSAGGQLALWAAARDRGPAGPPTVAAAGVVALAPVADLAAAFEAGLGDGAAEDFLRRTPADGPDRYAAASPAAQLPLGTRQVVVHGSADELVPLDHSRRYVAAAAAAGDVVSLVEVPDTGHFDIINPRSKAFAAVAAAVDDMTPVR